MSDPAYLIYLDGKQTAYQDTFTLYHTKDTSYMYSVWTYVRSRNMTIRTQAYREPREGLPVASTAIFHEGGNDGDLLKRDYRGDLSLGGLDEAHHHVVAAVRAGTLPIEEADHDG